MIRTKEKVGFLLVYSIGVFRGYNRNIQERKEDQEVNQISLSIEKSKKYNRGI